MQRRRFLLAMGLGALAPLAIAESGRETLEPLSAQPPIPDFDLVDLDGQHHRPADYRGRVLLINFWATWCPPCRAEMPSMERLLKLREGAPLSIIAIAMGQDQEKLREYAATNPHPFPLLADPDGKVSEAFGVKGLPTTFLTNGGGRLAFRAEGGRSWDSPKMQRAVSLLLSTL